MAKGSAETSGDELSGKPLPADEPGDEAQSNPAGADSDSDSDAEPDTEPDSESDGEPDADAPAETEDASQPEDSRPRRRRPHPKSSWAAVLAWVVLPSLALLLAITAGVLRWQYDTMRYAQIAGVQALQAAREGTVAMLSYKPETVEKDLTAAQDHLTGTFRDSYTQLTKDVVIPGAKQQRISAVARVPAAATVSADWGHAVVLVFVDQTTVIGDDPPTDMASTVRVKLDKVGDRWLISEFQPI
ncbi:hypothetical protein OSH39_02795 [Mycobacterium ulcerans]|uniref:Conserved protein n=1 Tax=Mycobacterium ulcerans (strain Agy99) TaxID=362242 RepID=A0PUG3_MYCUA|nr:hypothetical protein [Mycobacterium ulcerans]ABL05982.1 conserved protein [Mycobacterium ulcerans Agy99]MEB3904225.1 hypothetical protein [Mycobacterium ulcerans]MEB3908364.1 hypothetical protein [Mycobacterium ulcerans]MEB3918664.1 hypothetical protein [Mycobacterium ulcerans]MEB3922794.1 hypothetical protein [Mycobacterium ulcerans]